MGQSRDERGIIVTGVLCHQEHLNSRTDGRWLDQMSYRSQKPFVFLISKFKCLSFVQSKGGGLVGRLGDRAAPTSQDEGGCPHLWVQPRPLAGKLLPVRKIELWQLPPLTTRITRTKSSPPRR